MALVLIAGPALEPVSLDEVKVHLRIDHVDEDVLLASLVTTARIHLETMLGLSFITQQWKLVLDKWPDAINISLPLGPVQQITGIALYNTADQVSVIDTSSYALDANSQPPRLVWRGDMLKPAPERAYNGIEISLTTGFGANAPDVPLPLRQAILLLVSHWYENREPVGLGNEIKEIPQMVTMLTNAYRRVRL
ncbi:MAG: hypothetical protein GY927_08855 [bacterium]|nr:hypothetical protein [bacterium]